MFLLSSIARAVLRDSVQRPKCVDYRIPYPVQGKSNGTCVAQRTTHEPLHLDFAPRMLVAFPVCVLHPDGPGAADLRHIVKAWSFKRRPFTMSLHLSRRDLLRTMAAAAAVPAARAPSRSPARHPPQAAATALATTLPTGDVGQTLNTTGAPPGALTPTHKPRQRHAPAPRGAPRPPHRGDRSRVKIA